MKPQLIYSLTNVGFSAEQLSVLNEVFVSHDAYRSRFGFPDKAVDNTWLGALSPPCTSAVISMCDIVYGHSFNADILRMCDEKSAAEMVGAVLCEPFM